MAECSSVCSLESSAENDRRRRTGDCACYPLSHAVLTQAARPLSPAQPGSPLLQPHPPHTLLRRISHQGAGLRGLLHRPGIWRLLLRQLLHVGLPSPAGHHEVAAVSSAPPARRRTRQQCPGFRAPLVPPGAARCRRCCRGRRSIPQQQALGQARPVGQGIGADLGLAQVHTSSSTCRIQA